MEYSLLLNLYVIYTTFTHKEKIEIFGYCPKFQQVRCLAWFLNRNRTKDCSETSLENCTIFNLL